MGQLQQPALVLPAIRQGLQLMEGPSGEDGSPTWALHDPQRNQFFRMGRRAFSLLGAWQSGMEMEQFLTALNERGIESSPEEVSELIKFMVANNLIELSSPEDVGRLCFIRAQVKVSPLKWLLKNYLYIRVPLLRPDRFLERTLPLIAPLYSKWTRRILLTIGLIGVYLAARQWETFWTTFQDFFNVRGMIVFGITLFFVKAIHELGHAYAAKRMGCKVPVMGVAFLVMYPMLYTDTTDSWRLKSHRQRLSISVAGVKVELALAMIATLLWSFLDDGVLRSAAFFVATVSWVGSLAVNMSPFMRFDGYYALSDWLGAENLQERAFSLARWHMRRLLLGFGDPRPEALTERREFIFVAYAWGTWIYRFFLFLGIAFLVYHAFFKALGILLFSVEIVWFLAMPICKELQVWWDRRDDMDSKRLKRAYLVFGALLLLVLCIPWQGTMTLPAVLKARQFQKLHAPLDGQIVEVMVQPGEIVEAGRVLVRLASPELELRRQTLNIQAGLLSELLDRSAGSLRELESVTVLQQQKMEVDAELLGIEEQLRQLQVLAPFSGRLTSLEALRPGQWVSTQTLLGTITAGNGTRLEAYVEEDDLHRVHDDARGCFFENMGGKAWLHANVRAVETLAVDDLEDRMLASIHGGDISARPDARGRLVPESATYRIQLVLTDDIPTPRWVSPGILRLEGERVSLAGRFFRYIAAVLIRESGF